MVKSSRKPYGFKEDSILKKVSEYLQILIDKRKNWSL